MCLTEFPLLTVNDNNVVLWIKCNSPTAVEVVEWHNCGGIK